VLWLIKNVSVGLGDTDGGGVVLIPDLLVSDLLDTSAMTAIIVCNNGTVVFINKTYLDVLGKKKRRGRR
jgi:hypothetical protein